MRDTIYNLKWQNSCSSFLICSWSLFRYPYGHEELAVTEDFDAVRTFLVLIRYYPHDNQLLRNFPSSKLELIELNESCQ